jgi:predicted kinase
VEAVILCGMQGSGKTTFYRDRFLTTHTHISMDLLKTRHREARFLELCLETRMPFVVDNTNPTVADRARYIEPARAAAFKVVGYLVEVAAAPRDEIPPRALRDFARRFVRPTPAEGFDELWHVSAAGIEPLLTTPPLF